MSNGGGVTPNCQAPTSSEADDWEAHWSDYGGANQRNPAQSYRRRLVQRELERDGRPTRLLDIGSGNGEFPATAAQLWPEAQLLGLERSESGVAQAQARIPTARVRVCDLLAQPDPAKDEINWATHAVCSEVLEHVDDPAALLHNARAWLAPGAPIVITVPGGPMSAFDRHIGHRRHFSPPDRAQVIRAAGLDVVGVRGCGFPFFNLYRALVIMRGEKLIEEARRPSANRSIRAGMSAFELLLRLSLNGTQLGWQTVGVARAG
jgi:SAM-dependent methyltransferase